MKKLSLIFLSLMFVFMVACGDSATDPDSTDGGGSSSSNQNYDEAFLDSVANMKSGIRYPNGNLTGYYFSGTGKKLTNTIDSKTYDFVKATSSTTATYKDSDGKECQFVFSNKTLKIDNTTINEGVWNTKL